MRLLVAVLVLLGSAANVMAEDNLPGDVAQMLACGHVFSLRSEDAAFEGDDDAALEFFNMGEQLLWEGRSALEAAGYGADEIDDADVDSAMLSGARYGSGEADQMVSDCLDAWPSP